MQLRVQCPDCRKVFQIPMKFAGREGECSQCGAIFTIPAVEVKYDEYETPPEINQAYIAAQTEEIPAFRPENFPPVEEFEAPPATSRKSGPKTPADLRRYDGPPDDDPIDDELPAGGKPRSRNRRPSGNLPLDESSEDAASVSAELISASITDSIEVAIDLEDVDAPESDDPQSSSDSNPSFNIGEDDLIDDDDYVSREFPIPEHDPFEEGPSADRILSRSRDLSSRKAKGEYQRPEADEGYEPEVDDDEGDEVEGPQRSGGESRKTLLMIIGGGGVLLLGAIAFHFFSAGPTIVNPTIETIPAPDAQSGADSQPDPAETNDRPGTVDDDAVRPEDFTSESGGFE